MSEPAPAGGSGRLGTGCGLFFLGAIVFILVVAVVSAIDTDAQAVAAGDFGSDWPLTVEEGVVVCSLGQVTFVHDEVEYAVNPVAMRTGLYERIEPIRADATSGAAKKSLDPLIDTGLDLCDG